jgi:hypothetical protein
MGRELIFGWEAETPLSPSGPMTRRTHSVLAILSNGYPQPKGRLLTCYAPVRRSTSHPKVTFALDLHVLSTPPAFVLSQDQTLHLLRNLYVHRAPKDSKSLLDT